MAPFTPNLPEELITEILVRLPVKSLLRLRAVSHLWLSLISSPNFINSQLHRASENHIFGEDNFPICQTDLSSDQIRAVHLELPCTKRELPSLPRLYLIGSCNGIVCAAASRKPIIYFWNPATRQSKFISKLHTIPLVDLARAHYGFGFDSVANDFKVVRVVKSAAEVYSANNNVWRVIEPPSISTNFSLGDVFSVCGKGFLCCLGRNKLITFDLNKEVFNCGITCPPFKTFFPFLTDFKGSVAVIDYNPRVNKSKITLWRLDDGCLSGGIQGSWTQIFNVDVAFQVNRVRFCLSSGDILLCSSRNHDVCSFYNPDKNEYKLVPIPIYRGNIFKYTESLVSIEGFKQVGWSDRTDDN